MAKVKSVLLVCTGNSCRSVIAEGLLKKELKRLGKNGIEVSSAGVDAIDGLPPTKETIEVMRQEGIDVSSYRSRRLTTEMIRKADMILAMAVNHMYDIIKKMPEAAPKTYLLKQCGIETGAKTCKDLDIEDPVGRSVEFYTHILGVIKKEIERIAKSL